MCSVIAVGNTTTPLSWLSWSRDQAFVFAIPWYMDKQVSDLINVIIFFNVQSISVAGRGGGGGGGLALAITLNSTLQSLY